MSLLSLHTGPCMGFHVDLGEGILFAGRASFCAGREALLCSSGF